MNAMDDWSGRYMKGCWPEHKRQPPSGIKRTCGVWGILKVTLPTISLETWVKKDDQEYPWRKRKKRDKRVRYGQEGTKDSKRLHDKSSATRLRFQRERTCAIRNKKGGNEPILGGRHIKGHPMKNCPQGNPYIHIAVYAYWRIYNNMAIPQHKHTSIRIYVYKAM